MEPDYQYNWEQYHTKYKSAMSNRYDKRVWYIEHTELEKLGQYSENNYLPDHIIDNKWSLSIYCRKVQDMEYIAIKELQSG